MDRVAAGWTVAVRRASPRELQRAIGSRLAQGRLEFKAEDPANVIPLADPDTGATLLVGTLHRPGSAMAGRRETAEFALAPSWLGLVVEPLSDALSLRVTAGGFTLTGRAEGLAMEQAVDATTVTAGGLTRRFDFAAQQAEALQRRMREQVLAAAAAPSLGRAVKRRDLALTMIALGLAPEAQTVLRVAAADDPRETDNADNAGLSGIAAMLAGRPAEATGLDDPRLSGSDEIAFWRALRPAMAGQDDPTAPTALAAGVPLLLGYPAAMRNRLAPLVAETLLQSGQIDAAKRLLTAMEDHPALALARALLLRSAGEGDKALAALDALAAGPDRLQRVRAGRQAVEARLADAALTPPQAADALEKLIFAWRGDGRELATRLRIAELRAQSDAWRPALAMLRESETLFPDEAQGIVARQRALVAALLDGPSLQTLPALDLVALVDENAGLLPTSAEGDTVMARLADRLVALDLPRRAAPLLQKMTAAAPAGASKAGLGNRLAGLRLQEGDAPGALQALAESAAEGLPDALAEARAVTAARATARTGDVRAAVALLNNLQGEEAQRARAAIHEDAGQWPQASAALAVLLPGMLPADGPLDERQQRFLLRLATAATQAGDADLLARLRTEQGARLPSGPVGDLFRLLTADSVTAVTDLPRAARELALARAISTEAGTTQAGATVAGRR